ncbi:DUF808 domain-containing protein [Novosphingopyxis sp.]|uniref:DUF808 domain-containing protein n=1 Tax=Novosphingopyxis sp. TaxID=2709690 RepID=UPI003B5CAB1D
MPSGLAALLDDVAGIAKLAAASVDDVGVAASRAGTKAAGLVIDDTAVTPKYVTGLSPERELPIIWKIAKGSLFNKLVILVPVAMLLSAFLPWALTPILMLGGTYLSFEGAEKILHKLFGNDHKEQDAVETLNSAELEKQRVTGAVRTDMILSAEIVAISLGEITDQALITQGITLIAVSIAITAGVYGAVGLLVKLDDIGLHLARDEGAMAGFGRGLVKIMPYVLSAITVIGTAAMLWVGGGIIVHGLESFDLSTLPDAIHGVVHGVEESAGGILGWLSEAALYGVVGIILGSVVVGLHSLWVKLRSGH